MTFKDKHIYHEPQDWVSKRKKKKKKKKTIKTPTTECIWSRNELDQYILLENTSGQNLGYKNIHSICKSFQNVEKAMLYLKTEEIYPIGYNIVLNPDPLLFFPIWTHAKANATIHDNQNALHYIKKKPVFVNRSWNLEDIKWKKKKQEYERLRSIFVYKHPM